MIVELALYEEGHRRLEHLPLERACEAAQRGEGFVWIDLYEPAPEEFDAVRAEFDLHPLAVEDALLAHERPKLDRYGDVTFLVLKNAVYDDEREAIDFGETMVFAAAEFVITVRHGQGTDLTGVRAELEADAERLKLGPVAAVHAIVDFVVDGYEPVVTGLQSDIDEVEEAIFSGGGASDATRRIYALGREVLEFARAVGPLVEPAARLSRSGALPGDSEEVRTYFRDIEDHVVRIDGWVASQRELLSNLLQANLTQVTITQNGDMRRISAWVAIAAVPTMIAGIYGMNFEHMPELGWRLGYPLVLSVIAVVCGTLYVRFRRAGWL